VAVDGASQKKKIKQAQAQHPSADVAVDGASPATLRLYSTFLLNSKNDAGAYQLILLRGRVSICTILVILVQNTSTKVLTRPLFLLNSKK
jgi:hypothetical protein